MAGGGHEKTEAERNRRSRGGPVLIGALAVDSLGNGLFLPLSLVYFVELTDVPLALVGVLLTIANAVTLPIPIWVGTLADRFGALPLVVGAQLLQAVGFLAYALVTGPVGILVSSALVAIGVRFFWSAVFTAIADHVDGGTSTLSRDTWYALANGARTAGLAVGGLVTGIVVADGRDATYRAVAYAAAACFAAAAVLIMVFVRTGPGHEHPPLERSGYATGASRRARPLPRHVPVLVHDLVDHRARVLRHALRAPAGRAVDRARAPQRREHRGGAAAGAAAAGARAARPRPVGHLTDSEDVRPCRAA